MIRTWFLAALAVGFWLLSAFGQSQPEAARLDAPATSFSAARATALLARILPDQKPHPAGSAEAGQVRARILQELAAMGVKARTQSGMSCYVSPRSSFLPCGTVTDIIAEVSPGQGNNKGKAILLMAHSDSVPAGPGAGDDGSGVAILLETMRALKARGGVAAHPVVALFTDGEEVNMLGAASYLHDPAQRERVGAVINVEARGNRGFSYLFQTSRGNARLIDLYAQSVPRYATSSLYQEIYQRLPNDTDLTPMLALGVPALNFAFIGGFAHYHTPLDRRENLDPRSVQQQGEAVLGMADRLRQTDLAQLKDGDAIYLDILERWLPRIPAAWALPLAIACFVLIVLAGWWSGERLGWKRAAWAVAAPPLLIAACVGMGYVLHGIAAWISGQADPSFAHPAWLRLSLALGALAPAICLARAACAITCWLWFAGLAIACALFAPGLAPYFLFPSLVAAPLLLATVRGGRGLALFAAALAALAVWIGLSQESEALMGLRMHPLFMVSAGFGLLALLPLMKTARGSCLASLLAAVALAAAAGLQPAYSDRAPQRLNLRYAEMDGKAAWLADPVSRLPQPLRAAADFSAAPQPMADFGKFYVAPAGRARFPTPRVTVSRQGDEVTLEMNMEGDGFILLLPNSARPQAVRLNGLDVHAAKPLTGMSCATPDCRHARLTLRLGAQDKGVLTLLTYAQGLPPEGARLLQARPPQAVPSQSGDRTLLVSRIAIPAR
ncbi:MAG TPA: M20/M25/M40 family metallo-hydrolase [Rhizomicrobium sp.]|nr:M20/M25/M40 family metallo-hydrolase [Rhizomicrobium sp.]